MYQRLFSQFAPLQRVYGRRQNCPLYPRSFYLLFWSVFLGSLLFVPEALAHDGQLFQEEIGKIEKLFTGGYMHLGLLGGCGLTAIMGAVQQNAWMFLSGILAGVFAFFMKDWILATFAVLI